MTHIIQKDFDFAYGHRIFNQTLNAEYSLDAPCKCRHLHGHEAKVTVYMESEFLNSEGMVVDFTNLKWLKKFLDLNVDHKFILSINDPLFSNLTGGFLTEDGTSLELYNGTSIPIVPIEIPGIDEEIAVRFDASSLNGELLELLESFVIVDFVPTSENLSKWIHNVAHKKMGRLGVEVTRVDWWETNKSCARYEL